MPKHTNTECVKRYRDLAALISCPDTSIAIPNTTAAKEHDKILIGIDQGKHESQLQDFQQHEPDPQNNRKPR